MKRKIRKDTDSDEVQYRHVVELPPLDISLVDMKPLDVSRLRGCGWASLSSTAEAKFELRNCICHILRASEHMLARLVLIAPPHSA